jgi:phenylalanyl-tRNA synthetase beta chain
LKLFEFGRVYKKVATNGDPLPGYHEENHLAILVTGSMNAENWNAQESRVDFFELKGYLEGILSKLSLQHLSWAIEPFSSDLISSGLRYSINGTPVLIMGTMADQALKPFDLRQPVFYAELNWDLLFSLIPVKNISFTGIPKFPEVRRDLALLIDQNISFSQIEKLAFQTERTLLRKVGLFDVYEGDKIAAGKKSYAPEFYPQG